MTTCMVAMGGGGGAFMVSFFSSVDPIFYLHHCNLDRVADVDDPRCRKAPMSLLGRRTIPVLQRRKEPTCLEEQGRRLHDARSFRLGFISWLGRGPDTRANARCRARPDPGIRWPGRTCQTLQGSRSGLHPTPLQERRPTAPAVNTY
jgi:hypothetical protein